MKATLAVAVEVPHPATPASATTPDSDAPAPRANPQPRLAWSTFVGGVVTRFGYVLGGVATRGLEVLAAASAVGIALLLTFVIATGAVGSGDVAGGRARLAAAIGSVLLLIAAAIVGSDKLPSG